QHKGELYGVGTRHTQNTLKHNSCKFNSVKRCSICIDIFLKGLLYDFLFGTLHELKISKSLSIIFIKLIVHLVSSVMVAAAVEVTGQTYCSTVHHDKIDFVILYNIILEIFLIRDLHDINIVQSQVAHEKRPLSMTVLCVRKADSGYSLRFTAYTLTVISWITRATKLRIFICFYSFIRSPHCWINFADACRIGAVCY
ncbi:hypothetical protein AGLY_013748, partial [Aphis glycines]